MIKHVAIALLCLNGLLLSGCDTLKSTLNSIMPKQSVEQQKIRELSVLQQTTVNASTLWQVNIGNNSKLYTRIHPHLSESAVFVAGQDEVSAWNKQNGAALWRTPVSEVVTGGVNGGGGTVFVGTADGSAIALNAADGQVKWVERLSSEVLSVSNVGQERVVFRTADGTLSALAVATGQIIWQQRKPTPQLSIRGAGVPIVLGNAVVAGFDDGTVTAFDLSNGRGLWEVILSVPRGNNELKQITDVDGRLKLLGSALFATSYSGRIAGISIEKGQVAWSKSSASRVGVDANPESLMTVSNNGDLWRLNPQNGDPIWKMDDLQTRKPTTPTLMGQYVVVGDSEGFLHWISLDTGKMANRLRSDPQGYSVPAVAEGNRLYSFGKSGILAAHTIQ